MTCRSTNTTPSLSCFGGNTGGAQLSYDNEQRLIGWQNAPTSPTTTDAFLYDGEGHRVEQQVGQFSCGQACGMTYTTTQYVAGGIEEMAQTGGTSPSTTTTKYYTAGGLLVGERVNGTISYLASDGLGSVSAALSSSGSLTAAQLFTPYGAVRYSSGTMPTARGFTGQYSDASVTGLDYYGARFYDPVAGQFTSADLMQGPNRYGYVAGNPTTATDPSGHLYEEDGDLSGGGGDGPGGDGPGGGGGSMGYDYSERDAQAAQAYQEWEITVNGDAEGFTDAGWKVSDYGSTGGDFQVNDAQTPGVEVNDTVNADGEVTGESITTADGTTETFSSSDLAAGQEADSEEAQAAKEAEGTYAEQKAQAEENAQHNDGNQGSKGGKGLNAFGGSPNGPNPGPRGPRAGTDISVNSDGTVSAQTAPNPQGASTTTDPAASGLTGHYYTLAPGTPLPEGLAACPDGVDVGGTMPPGHVTIYPTQDMPYDEYRDLFLGLPWEYGGKI